MRMKKWYCEIHEADGELLVFPDGDTLMAAVENNDPSVYGMVELNKRDHDAMLRATKEKGFAFMSIPLKRYAKQLGY